MLTAIVVSIKMNQDSFFSNADYAEDGGIDVQELNQLESAFIRKLNWNLVIPE